MKVVHDKIFVKRTVLQYSHVGHFSLGLVDVDGVVVDQAGQFLEAAVQGGRVDLLVSAALQVLGHHVLLQADLGALGQGLHVAVQQHGLLLHLSLVTELDRSPPSLATYDGRGGEESSEGRQAERDEESQGSEGQESSQETSGSTSVVLVLALTLLVNIDWSSTSTSSSTSCRAES